MMNRKEMFFGAVCTLGSGLMVLFISFIFGDKVELKLVGVFGSATTMLLWLLFYRFMIYLPAKQERMKSPWAVTKEKNVERVWGINRQSYIP